MAVEEAVKRLFDFALSLFAFTLLAIPMLITGLMIKLTSLGILWAKMRGQI
ncbi:MAG: hypothetical protein ABII06_09145 [Pseudomonadota bacterium]